MSIIKKNNLLSMNKNLFKSINNKKKRGNNLFHAVNLTAFTIRSKNLSFQKINILFEYAGDNKDSFNMFLH